MTVKPVGSRDPHSTRSGSRRPDQPVGPSPADLAGTEFPYAPEAVGQARRILGGDLRRLAVAPTAADDAVLILSELVSNALRHARPLAGGKIRVAWWMEDSRVLRIAVTDGGRSVPEPDPDAWYGDPGAASADPDILCDQVSGAALGQPEAAVLTAVALDEVDESAVDGRGLGIVGALADAWGVEPFHDSVLAEDGTGPAGIAPVTDPSAPKTVWASVRIHARHAAPPPPDKKRRRDRGGRPRGGLRLMRTVLAAMWPRGSRRPDGGEPTAWVPRYLALAGHGG